MIGSLIGRNIKLFFRDKAGVFFSLLGPIIMFVLYLFFLGNLQKSNIRSVVPGVSAANLNYFVNSWIFAGILLITTVTTSLAAMQVFVGDRASDRFKDFVVSPIKRSKIVMAYLGSTFVISLVMTTLMFAISQLYIKATGGNLLSLHQAVSSYVVLVLLCAVFSALASLMVTFLKSVSAFTSVSVIIGTSVGFLAAVYVPVGSLPAGVVNVINILPFSQAAGLLRAPFVQQSADGLTAGNTTALNKLNNFYGITLHVGSKELSTSFLIIVLAGIFVAATSAAIWRINRKLA